nr:alpha/beta hydrolase [Pedobacter panaciterrae]
MKRIKLLIVLILTANFSFAQKIEKIYLDANDTTNNMYIAVLPENMPVKAFIFLLDGFGASPENVLIQTGLPKYAASQGILTIIPVLKTGPLYFGVDSASQQSLKEQISSVVDKYKLQGKDFYIGGFSIGGSCAVKYAELATRNNYPLKPKAVFAVDPPLDWERFYNGANRLVRINGKTPLNSEVTYMIDRIEKEMGGNPKNSIDNFYNVSPYSFSDTTQSAVKLLKNTPVMIISEPDIQWWLKERGYDYSYINIIDQVAMINELHQLGNIKAILVTTTGKGFRKPNNIKHPHSWSIANEIELVKWLTSQ